MNSEAHEAIAMTHNDTETEDEREMREEEEREDRLFARVHRCYERRFGVPAPCVEWVSSGGRDAMIVTNRARDIAEGPEPGERVLALYRLRGDRVFYVKPMKENRKREGAALAAVFRALLPLDPFARDRVLSDARFKIVRAV